MRERSKEKETYWSGAAEEVEAAAEGVGGGCTTTHGRGGGGGASFSMDAAEKGEDKEENAATLAYIYVQLCKNNPYKIRLHKKSSHPCIFCGNNPLRCTVSLDKLSNFQRCQCLKNVKIWVNSIKIEIC